jgi:hypothetical protein
MDALERANEIRSRRAEWKKDVKAGRVTTAQALVLLADPPAEFESMKVFDLLLALRKVGRVKANKLLQRARISPSKTLGGLTRRQTDELLGLMRWRP